MRYLTICWLLAKVISKDLEADYIDVNIAFLNFTLKEEVYIEVLTFIKDVFLEVEGPDIYLKLRKALYRLKQASKAWF